MSWNEGNIGVAVLYAVLRGPLRFPVGTKIRMHIQSDVILPDN